MDLLVAEKAYRKARKHNRRSEDMVFFEHEQYANIASLINSVNASTYTPGSNYSFIHRRGSKPREVFAAEPEMKILMARLLDIEPLIEKHLPPCTFNNRVGMGTQAAVNKVIENMYACSRGYTRPTWVIKLDFKGYFPNMVQQVAYEQFCDIITNEYKGNDKDELLFIVRKACFFNSSDFARRSPRYEWDDIPGYKSIYTRPDGIGGLIGFTFWQKVASLYPSKIDNYITENVTPYYVRFVDDCVLITDNKEMTLASIPKIREMCAEIGITIHPSKFYCQPAEHGLEFLGFHIKPRAVHINRRIVRRAFRAARDKEKDNEGYVSAINAYLGMIKATSDIRKARELLDAVERKGIEKDYKELKIKLK